MRFLITGGAGFVGSHLCEELLDRGDEVHVLDDLSTGSIENIAHLRDRDGFEYTIDTAEDAEVVTRLVGEADAVYHLAAAVGVELIVESPVRTIEANVHATEVVLMAAAVKNKPVFIASTSEVYGKNPQIPFVEGSDMVLGPTSKGRWAYACSKAIDEFLAIAYWRERRLPAVVGRLFNTVGPRQTGRYGMVIPNLVRQALSEEPLTVHGDGTQSRCFCHVRDTVRALADLLPCEEAFGEVFNVGNSTEITILELAELIRETAGSGSEIKRIPYEQAYGDGFEDMMRRVPDLTRIQGLLGWRPERDLEAIVRDVIEYQRQTGKS